MNWLNKFMYLGCCIIKIPQSHFGFGWSVFKLGWFHG